MHIQIELPRPGMTLLLLAAVSGWGMVLLGPGQAQPPTAQVAQTVTASPATTAQAAPRADAQEASSSALGARTHLPPADESAALPASPLSEAERNAEQARQEQDMLQAKQEILRYQLTELQRERQELGGTIDPKLEDQFQRSTQRLTALILDEKKAEEFLLSSFNQLWEAEGRANDATTLTGTIPRMALQWPVEPLKGISAYFLDAAYKQLFKREHHAIDIPTPQGAPVRAAAGGVVTYAVDHGLGFNYIVIEHPGGYSTLYGHISKIRVKQGDHIVAGDVIGDSGGMPGTEGAGPDTTGPHLHFAVHANGQPIDPLKYLPEASEVQAAGDAGASGA